MQQKYVDILLVFSKIKWLLNDIKYLLDMS